MEALAKGKRVKDRALYLLHCSGIERPSDTMQIYSNTLTQSIQAPNTQQLCNTKFHFLGKGVNDRPITLVRVT